MRRLLLVLAWVFVRALVPLAVACAPAVDARTDRPIEVVVPTEVSTLDPRFATRSLDVKVTRLVHAGLFGLEPDTLEPVPLLAESFRRVDELTLEVRLREGIVFHSGRPLRAADACATFEALRDPAVGSPHRAVVENIGRCAARDARTLVLSLAAPRATILSDLEVPILRADEAGGAPRPDGELDGLGPFAVTHVASGEIRLAPAVTHAFPEPRHAVVVRTVRDENARVQRLLAGRSDVGPNAVSPALLPALSGRAGLDVVAHPGANVTYLVFQNDRAPFTGGDVRHAVARAIDRELVAKTLFAGRASAATSLLPPGNWAYAPTPSDPYAPEEARRVLSRTRPVTLLTSTERARITLARAVAQMLEDAGLTVSVVPLDLGVLLSRLDAGDFDMALLQMPEITEPNVLSWFFHRRGVPGEGGQGRNRARYRSEAASALLDRAAAVSERPARREIYRKLALTMAADLPVVPLWHEDQLAVVSSRAESFRPSAEGRWLALARLE